MAPMIRARADSRDRQRARAHDAAVATLARLRSVPGWRADVVDGESGAWGPVLTSGWLRLKGYPLGEGFEWFACVDFCDGSEGIHSDAHDDPLDSLRQVVRAATVLADRLAAVGACSARATLSVAMTTRACPSSWRSSNSDMVPPAHPSLNALVVDDEPNIRKVLSASLATDGHRATGVGTVDEAVEAAARHGFDIALVDLRLGMATGLDLIPKLLAQQPTLKIIVITAFATVETAVEAMRRGASDYLPKPFTPAQVRLVVERVARLRTLEQQVAGLTAASSEAADELDLTTSSPAMRHVIDLARQVAASDATVLLRGESGTGKGVLARAIHRWSERAVGPFVTVSAPSLSAELLESELFGHAKGAFTGAARETAGRVAAAEGGTLFLDEIGDLPVAMQPKLLRFLQDHEYERVGDPTPRRADVRVVTATNVDLPAAVKAGRFREDLLYRISVIPIDVPPLRERAADVTSLSERLLAFFTRRRGAPVHLAPDAAAALVAYDWPGNVRELRNVIERAAILCRGDHVGVEHLPSNLMPTSGAEPRLGDPVPFERIEAVHLRRLIAAMPTMDEVARVLGIDAATLWRKRKKYGI